MDLIAIDIGNSTISLGVFTHQKLSRTEHLPVNKSSHLSKKISALRAMCTPRRCSSLVVVLRHCSEEGCAVMVDRHQHGTLRGGLCGEPVGGPMVSAKAGVASAGLLRV